MGEILLPAWQHLARLSFTVTTIVFVLLTMVMVGFVVRLKELMMEKIQICDECAYYVPEDLYCRLHQKDMDPLKSCDQWEERAATENYQYGVDTPDVEDGWENGDASNSGDNGEGDSGEQADN